ncbi:MAG: choice-of-anchor Q domain-containing protein [Acidobacteriota bacterium]
MPRKEPSSTLETAYALGLFIALLVPALSSRATTYVITDTRDVVAVDLSCTLREALTAVRDRVAVNECSAGTASNTIELGFGTYTFDQGAFTVPDTADPLDLEITGINGLIVGTRIDLADSNGFIVVDGNDFGTEIEHRMRIAGVQIQNGATSVSGVVGLSGSGGLTLENMSFVDGTCVATCDFAASAASYSGSGDVVIRDSFFGRNGDTASLWLNPSSQGTVLIENTILSDNTGGLLVRARDQATVTLEDLEIERAGLDAPASSVLFLELRDDTTLTARRVILDQNLLSIPLSAPASLSLAQQAEALLEDWRLTLNQSAAAGALSLSASDTSDVDILGMVATNNTSAVGSASDSGAVDLRAFGGEITWTGGEIRNNFTASTGSVANAGINFDALSGGAFSVERLEIRSNRHLTPQSQPSTSQVFLITDDPSSRGYFANSLIADSPGLGVRAAALESSILDLTNLTFAGNLTTLDYEAASVGSVSLVQGCLFFGNDTDAPVLTGADVLENNNSTTDPLYVDAAAGNYRLSAGSPAIDSGGVSSVSTGRLDLDGRPRQVSGALPAGPGPPDVGAYEFQPEDIFRDGFESGDLSRWSAVIQQ